MEALARFQSIKKDLFSEHGTEDIHQQILNVGYRWWQEENATGGYAEMVDYMGAKYGPLARLAILAGKYNQQVCNGGHSQYVFNGYAASNHDNNADLHNALVSLTREYATPEIKESLLPIIEKLKLVKDGDEYDAWEGDSLDDEYYKIDERIMKQWEAFFAKALDMDSSRDDDKKLIINKELINKINDHNLEIESIAITESAAVIRFDDGKDKIEKIRTELLDSGWGKPISCHRDEGSVSCFMMLWYK